MALPPIRIPIEISGPAVEAALSGIANKTKAVGDEADKSVDKFKQLDAAIAQVSGQGLVDAANRARDFSDALDESKNRLSALNDQVEQVRNIGVGIAATGATAVALGEHFSDAFVEADRLGGRLSTLFSSRGLDDQISKVQELGTELAGLTGGDDDATALAIGQAAVTGRVNALRQYGIVLDANAKASIAAAGAAGTQEAAQETLNQILIAGAAAAQQLKAGQDEATAASGAFSVRIGNLEESIGRASTRAKSSLQEGLLSPIVSIVEQSEGLQDVIGYITTIGGTALTSIGGIIAFVAQIGQASIALTAFRAAQVTTAAATTASGTAAAGAAVGFGTLATSIGASVAAATAAAAPFIALAAGIGIAAYGIARGVEYLVNNRPGDKNNEANIAKGKATDDARLKSINEGRVAKGLREMTKEEFEATEANDGEETESQQRALVNLDADDRKVRRDQRKSQQTAATLAPPAPRNSSFEPDDDDDGGLSDLFNGAPTGRPPRAPRIAGGNRRTIGGNDSDTLTANLISTLLGGGGQSESGNTPRLNANVLNQRQTNLPNGNFIIELRIQVDNPIARTLGMAGRAR